MAKEITKSKLGPFLEYLERKEVVDVDWNGSDLWYRTDDNQKHRVPYDKHRITPDYVLALGQQIADHNSENGFNPEDNTIETDIDSYRITCIHNSVAISGTCIFIRKTSVQPRLSYKGIIAGNYCDKPTLNLLLNSIYSKFNLAIIGSPGVGKTEIGKFLSLAIPDNERVVTIEDTAEWHYKQLKPNADGIEIVTNKNYSDAAALKTCLRSTTDRVIKTEVRDREVLELIKLWNMGVKGICTLHTDGVRKIPDRLLSMMPSKATAQRYENNIYEFLDMGMLINMRKDEYGKEQRYIDELCYFERKDGVNECIMLIEDGKVINKTLSKEKMKKLNRKEIINPYELAKELGGIAKYED